MVVSFVAVGPVVAGNKVCVGRLGGFLEAGGSDRAESSRGFVGVRAGAGSALDAGREAARARIYETGRSTPTGDTGGSRSARMT